MPKYAILTVQALDVAFSKIVDTLKQEKYDRVYVCNEEAGDRVVRFERIYAILEQFRPNFPGARWVPDVTKLESAAASFRDGARGLPAGAEIFTVTENGAQLFGIVSQEKQPSPSGVPKSQDKGETKAAFIGILGTVIQKLEDGKIRQEGRNTGKGVFATIEQTDTIISYIESAITDISAFKKALEQKNFNPDIEGSKARVSTRLAELRQQGETTGSHQIPTLIKECYAIIYPSPYGAKVGMKQEMQELRGDKQNSAAEDKKPQP